MELISEVIRARRSVRSFDGRVPEAETLNKLAAFVENVENPFGVPVSFRFLNAKEQGLVCPVVSGTELFIGAKTIEGKPAALAFGYSFERFVLYAQSLGLGTVWVGGTMNRPAFEKAMELARGEVMPAVSPLGYTAEKMSIREALMRKSLKADERLPFSEIFFDGSFDRPLSEERAGKLKLPLEMLRWAPSAVNRQPWRVLVDGAAVHFYLKRSKGMSHGEKLDMQMTDMGAALCHFALAAQEQGLELSLSQTPPAIAAEGLEYVATYEIK